MNTDIDETTGLSHEIANKKTYLERLKKELRNSTNDVSSQLRALDEDIRVWFRQHPELVR